MPTFKIIAWLAFGSALLATPTYTNTGSAHHMCIADSLPLPQPLSFVQTANGTSLDPICPTGYTGGGVSGEVGDLTAQGATGYAPAGLQVGFSLQSTLNDSLTPTGGVGSGIVEFTMTYTWDGLNDLGFDQGSADLLFNGSGMPAWSFESHACFTPPGQFCPIDSKRTDVATIDEPVTYGTPFSYQADLLLSGQRQGLLFTSNNLAVSISLATGGQLSEFVDPPSDPPPDPTPVPEPVTWVLVVLGLFLVIGGGFFVSLIRNFHKGEHGDHR